MSYGPRRVHRPREVLRGRIWLTFIGIFVLISIAMVVPSFMYVEKAPPSRPDLIYKGVKQRYSAVIERGEPYVPFNFVKDAIDPNAFWDKTFVVVTTKDKVVKLKTDSLTAYVNQHPVDLKLPVILDGSEPYIPASSLELLYPVGATLYSGNSVFVVRRVDVESSVGTLSRDTVVRIAGSPLARRTGVLPAGSSVEIYDSVNGWLCIVGEGGIAGWVRRTDVFGQKVVPPLVKPPRDYVPPPLKGSRVGLVWEQVDTRTPDPSRIGPMDGLNVVSPTWFRLGEKPGEVENYADSRYVAWAHSEGYKVWALFSNSFELDRTRAVLRDSDMRDKVISQILVYSKIYSLDGINLDFENVYQDDGPYLTQFVRELTPLLHEMGLTVSIDITVRSQSPTWSLCYERERLAEVVDYVMLMAYDQYGASSKVSGPNAAIPWTESAVATTLQEVPREKLILGVPFYMRLWTETLVGSGVQATQRALGMDSAQEWLQSEGITPKYDEETGLMYAEKASGGETYKLWIEDESSMAKRMDIARSYGLAGIAAWRRGFENPAIWKVIADYTR